MKVLQHPCQENRGLSASRNLAIRNAKGEWLALLDCDDVWMPEKLSRQVEKLQIQANAVLCYNYSRYVDGNGQYLTDQLVPWMYDGGHGRAHASAFSVTITDIVNEKVIIHASSAVFRKSAATKHGGFFEGFRGGGDDIVLWSSLSLEGLFIFIDESLSHYRVHSQQWMNNCWHEIGKETEILICRQLMTLSIGLFQPKAKSCQTYF